MKEAAGKDFMTWISADTTFYYNYFLVLTCPACFLFGLASVAWLFLNPGPGLSRLAWELGSLQA